MIVGSVIEHQVGNYSHALRMRRGEEFLEVIERPVFRQDRTIIRNIVTTVAQRRGVHRQHPQAINSQPLQIVDLLSQPAKIADPVVVRVVITPDKNFIKDRVFVPEKVRIIFHTQHFICYTAKLIYMRSSSATGRCASASATGNASPSS